MARGGRSRIAGRIGRDRSVGRHRGAQIDLGHRIAIRALSEFREARRDAPDEVHDAVSDRVIDALMRHPELCLDKQGRVSTPRVRAVVKRNFLWVLSSWQRIRLRPNGSAKPHPAAARSLDASVSESSETTLLATIATCLSPERVVIGREALHSLLEQADAQDPVTGEIIRGYVAGHGPREISAKVGVAENAVSARKGRFVRRPGVRELGDA